MRTIHLRIDTSSDDRCGSTCQFLRKEKSTDGNESADCAIFGRLETKDVWETLCTRRVKKVYRSYRCVEAEKEQ